MFIDNKRTSKSAKPERKCSKLCNHGEFTAVKGTKGIRKSKKQLLKEEEDAKLMALKIKRN